MKLTPNTKTGRVVTNEKLVSVLNEQLQKEICLLNNPKKRPKVRNSYRDLFNYYQGLGFGFHVCGALDKTSWKKFSSESFEKCTTKERLCTEVNFFKPNKYKTITRFRNWRGN